MHPYDRWVVYGTVICHHPTYLVSLLFAILLSLYLHTFEMFVTLRSIIRSIYISSGLNKFKSGGGRVYREVKTMEENLICLCAMRKESVKYRYSGKYTVNSAL